MLVLIRLMGNGDSRNQHPVQDSGGVGSGEELIFLGVCEHGLNQQEAAIAHVRKSYVTPDEMLRKK